MSEITSQITDNEITFEPVLPKQALKEKLRPYIFLCPSLILFILFTYFPFFKTLFISMNLTNLRGCPQEFVGFQNYKDLLTSHDFINSIITTFKFVLYTTIPSLLLGLFLALLANNKLRTSYISRIFFSIPMAVSSAAASIIWGIAFHPSIGIINNLLKINIKWLVDPNWALISVSMVTIWMNLGVNFIFLYAGLKNIPLELTESASIDGAGYFRRLFNIILPMLSPTLFFVIFMDIMNAFQSFGQVNILTSGGPGTSTNLLVFSIYKEAFFNGRFDTACAQSIILFIIMSTIAILQFKYEKKGGALLLMKIRKKNVLLSVSNLLIGLLIVSPILYAISASFMTPGEIFTLPPKLIPKSFYLGNYTLALNTIPILRFIINSFIVSTIVTIGQLIISSLSAYAFSFYEFKGKKLLFISIIATIMIPGEATIISNYLTISSCNLLDTYIGLIAPNLASAIGIFMMRQYFLTIPKELKEASLIDGCSDLQFLTKILIPVSKPITASLGIYIFITTWNQYMWPLLTTSKSQMRTVQIGLSMLKSAEVQNFGMILSGIVLIIIPSIFIFIIGQRRLIDGITSGAIKRLNTVSIF